MNYVDSAHRAIYLRDIIKRIEEEENQNVIKNSEIAQAYSILCGWHDRNRDHFIPENFHEVH